MSSRALSGRKLKKRHDVAVAHPGVVLRRDDRGPHELVVLAAGVGGAHRRLRVGGEEPLAVDQGVVGEPDPVPARVPVHGVVASADDAVAADADAVHGLLDGRQVPPGAPRRRVPAVEEGVDDDVADLLARRQLEAGDEVAHVAVHAAPGDQAHEVQPAPPPRGLGARLAQDAVLEEAAVLDGEADAREVLVDDTAGADVEVADLGVAHLARRQSHGRAGGVEHAVRVLRQQPVEDRRAGEAHGVVRARRGDAPAVHDDQDDRAVRRLAGARMGHAGSANLTMRLNPCGSRLAPPTRTPSMSGCAMSTSMLSGLTLPP